MVLVFFLYIFHSFHFSHFPPKFEDLNRHFWYSH